MATQANARTRLEGLVEIFDRDPAGIRDQMRDILDNDPQAFQVGAVRVLKSAPSSRAAQHVTRLLVSSESLFWVLCDAALPREDAVAMARMALQVDPMVDVNLAKKMVDGLSSDVSAAAAGRLMDVLETISVGNRIMPSLMRLLRQADPQLRSKAVLMIGRASRSVKWAQTRLAETDPRTRANAVESMWDVDTIEAREMLRTAARDTNNRVAANALFALYRMGDSWTIPHLFKMAAAEAPVFRASAAWAMGETGDSRFIGPVGRMMGDHDGMVRKRAFSALGRLKKAVAKTREGCEWRVAARVLSCGPSGRHLCLEAAANDGGAPPKLTPTQFLLTEDGQLVTHYQVEERPVAETMAVTFLFPRAVLSTAPAWVEGALRCLPRKRSFDFWRVAYYVADETTAQADVELPAFTANALTAATELEKAPLKQDCPVFWKAVRNCLQGVNPPTRGPRHLIVYCPEQVSLPEDTAEIISAAMTSQTSVQIIAGAPNAAMEGLCRRSKGRFQLARPGDDLSGTIEDAYLTLLSRFLVIYQPLSPTAALLNIRVSNATGWGESAIAL